MTSEVVIDVQQNEISIALLEDKNLVEYQTEPRSASFSVGNIYVAKVKKLMAGLNASFVDVGFERDAFLHYLDLGGQFNSYEKYLKQVQSDRKKLYPFSKALRLPDVKKDGSITELLQKDKEVLVQIVKEPISTKGPRLTAELSFAGRYLVLIPFNDKVSVSSKRRKTIVSDFSDSLVLSFAVTGNVGDRYLLYRAHATKIKTFSSNSWRSQPLSPAFSSLLAPSVSLFRRFSLPIPY